MRPASSSGRPKLEGIQALRGAAVTLVVLFHLGAIEAKYGGGSLLPRLSGAGVAGVDLFFAISGFVMAGLMRGAFLSGRNALGFLVRRVERIYPPYWFYTLIVLGVRFVRPEWVNASLGGRVNVAASFLLIPSDSMPALMVAWTLIFEMGFYLTMAAFLGLLPERLFPAALLAWAVAVAAGSFPAAAWGGPWLQTLFNPMALEFIAGALVAVAFQSGRMRMPSPGLLIALGFAAMAAAFPIFDRATGFAGYWARVPAFGFPAVLILAATVAAERGGAHAPAWLARIGDASYSIYLTHVLTLSALGRLWASCARPGRWDNAIALPILFLATLGAGWLSYLWLEKPMLAWFKARRLRGPEGA